MHKSILKKMKERASREDVNALADVVSMALDEMHEEHHEFYEHLECILYEAVYGKRITREMADKWVSHMKPLAKWTFEGTTDVMHQKGLNLDPVEFYVVMNMLYSDMHNVFEEDLDKYVMAAKDWLQDEDVAEHKLYNYYKHVVK